MEKYGGWGVIVFLSLLPLPFWSAVNLNEFTTAYGFWGNLGKIFGIIGFVLYALNLVLALRKKWLEYFFEGLNRVYIAHHITGGLALVFVLFHPLFLAIRLIEIKTLETFVDAAKYLLPRGVDTSLSYAEVERAVSINAGIIAFLGMVVLLILTFYVKLPYRIWLFTHRFLGVAFAFAVLHIAFIESDTSQSSFLKWYLVFLGIAGLAAFLYRTVFGKIAVRKALYQVDRIVVNGPMTAMELLPVGKPIKFDSGQFIFINFRSVDGVLDEVHPFSVASGRDEKKLRLYIKSLGDFTSTVNRIRAGSIAEVEGAFGKFSPAKYGYSKQIWIAGGIGITPFLSMVRNLIDTPEEVYLFYSVNKATEMVESKLLHEHWPATFPNFHFVPFISEERNGAFLNAQFIEETVGTLNDRQIFICGPPPMMKSMRGQLKAKGVKNKDIHSEEFSMS